MKKVLLITGTSVRNDTNIGKTLMTLFSDFKPEELAQLYFNPETPNEMICQDYYRIYEKKILKSFFGLRFPVGETVEPVMDGNATKPEVNALAFTKHKVNVFVKIAREMVWSLSHWKKCDLRDWLLQIKPDVIFTIMQDTNAATKIVIWAAELLHCPVVMFITDDYFNDHIAGWNPLRKMYYGRRKKLNMRLSKYVKTLVGCSEKASLYFKDALNTRVGVQTVFTPSAAACLEMPYKKQNSDDVVKIRYFGNLGLERWKVLQELGESIHNINRDRIRVTLEIYSSVTDTKIIRALTIENACFYCGWVSGKEFYSLLQDADIVVHVESFNKDMIRRTWVSISTKIADYLGAGKCILAIGPEDVASMEHIKGAACTVLKLEELSVCVERLISSADMRSAYQERARQLARKKHDIEYIRKQVRDITEAVAV